MKQFVYITLLLLCGFLNSHAQEVSPWEEAYNNLPQKHRDEFYEYARDFLENTYYTQMSLAIGEGVEFRANFIADIFGDENEADAARFQPEFLPESGKERFLTPDSYLQALSTAFKESDELEFIVSNIEEDKYVHGYTSPLNCFTQLDYDLEIKRRGETLLKRRCRMYCLFPKASYKREVRLMQIEPLEDFYIASEIFPVSETQLQVSDETRFQEAREWYDQGLTEKYLPVFQELANKGYAAAQYYLGVCYDNGEGVPKDVSKAVEWYAKAAEQGYELAQNDLGYYYLIGRGGVPKDERKAVEWCAKAAEQGNAKAQYNLGYCYENGIGVSKDGEKAVEWYTKAAEQGNAKARYYLGVCYENGEGVLKNISKAVEWYTKAANQGNADAQKALERLKKPPRCQGFIKNRANIPLKDVRISYSYGTYSNGRYSFRIIVDARTDNKGYFCFENDLPLGGVLKATCVGYKPYTFRWEGGLADITLTEE